MGKEPFIWDGPRGTAAYYAAAIAYAETHCIVCGERTNPRLSCPDPACESHVCPECGARHDENAPCGPPADVKEA